MTALREVAAAFGIEWEDEDLQRGTRTIDGAVTLVRQFGALLAGNALVQGIRDFAGHFEEQAGRIQDTADSLGLTTTELQELNYAAEQGGVRAEQMAAALATLQRNAVAAARGGGPAAAAVRALGLQLRDADGQMRSAGDLMDDIAVNLSRIEDPARRTALAQQLLGESGRRLLTVLHEGEGGLAQWRAELSALGGALSPESIEAAGAYGDELNRFRVASDSLRAQLAVGLLPMLTRFVTWVTRAGATLSQWVRGTYVVRLALIALAAAAVAAAIPVLAAWLPVIAPFLAVAAVVAAVILVVDDLITLFNGGDSAIGRFVDSLFGLGTAKQVVLELRAYWAALGIMIDDARGALARFWAGLQGIGAAVGAAFDAVQGAFQRVFDAIDDAFGGLLSSMVERLRGFVGGLGSALGGPVLALAQRLATGAAPGSYLARGRDLVAAQERLANANAPTPTATPRPGGGGGATTTIRRSQTNHITVPGAGDPAEVARRVHQRLRTEERAQRDADHPLPPNED